MIVRQEESTPIGDFYHDTGIFVIETSLANMVDEFEVDTDQLCFFCDGLIEKLKALKNHIKKVEKAWDKKQRQEDFQADLNQVIFREDKTMNKSFDAWYDGLCYGEFTYKEITEIFVFMNELKIKDEDKPKFCTMFKASLKLAFEAGGK